MKFSLIVPVYNVSKYILKCLKSIEKQSYKNYEVIIINDGSKDESEKIINKFIKNKNKFKCYKKENGGLSDARNYGLKYITGDYILFIDSDDYINKDLLLELSKEIKRNNPDLIKFNSNYDKDGIIKKMKIHPFTNLNNNECIEQYFKDTLFAPVWQYTYKTSFWQENNFSFEVGRLHEDVGIMPLILMNINKGSSISYIGYNYVIRENSIMTTKDQKKDLKKYEDYLHFFDSIIPIINNSSKINSKSKKLLSSFLANCVISKSFEIYTFDKKIVKNELKKRKILKYLATDNIKRIIKKFVYQIIFIIRGW